MMLWMRSACCRMICAPRVARSSPCDAPEELLGPTDDDSQRGRHLVRDPHRECPHRRDALGARERLVADALHLGHRELAREVELPPLIAQRHPAEREDERRRDEHAQDEPPQGALLAISFPRSARDDRDAPAAEPPGVDLREPGHRGPLGKPDLRGLGPPEALRG